MTLAEKQHAADYLQDRYEVSERRACKVVSIHRNTKRAYACKSFADDLDQVVIDLFRVKIDPVEIPAQYTGICW